MESVSILKTKEKIKETRNQNKLQMMKGKNMI